MKPFSITLNFSKQFVTYPFLVIFFLVLQICSAQNLLREPQKIVIDSKHNRMLVSNYATGDIVQIDSSGTQSYFMKWANFVDGLEIVGDTVYGIGNYRNVRAYNLTSKQLVMDITIPGSGSNYLSSITSDFSGHLFISCPRLNTIYKLRISDKKIWEFAKDNGLNKPNGILLEREKNRIVVIDDSPGAIIHAISLKDSTVSNLMNTSFDRPDGIVRDKNGNYYVGGYYLPGIYKIDPNFSTQPVLFHKLAANSYPNYVYPTYDAHTHSLLVTLYGNDTWERIYLGTTGIDSEELQRTSVLHQNFPNPFNPTTKINYSINEPTKVEIKIYDLLGRYLDTLLNKYQTAGNYEIEYNARKLSSGMYFYELRTNTFSETKKMVLLR